MRIPTITKNLLIVNVVAFLMMWIFQGMNFMGGGPIDLNNIFGLHFFLASDFHFYQLVTYMFMHANLEHIFFNMFALWMCGDRASSCFITFYVVSEPVFFKKQHSLFRFI